METKIVIDSPIVNNAIGAASVLVSHEFQHEIIQIAVLGTTLIYNIILIYKTFKNKKK